MAESCHSTNSGSEAEEQADISHSQVSHNTNNSECDVDQDVSNPQEGTTAPISAPSICGNSTRGRGRSSRRQSDKSQSNWSIDTKNFIEQTFSPREPTGPKNIPNSINVESTPLEYLSLFWDNTIWQLLLAETNRQAIRLAALKPVGYIAKNFVRKPLTIEELQAFFGLRIAIEMLVHKDRYESYWRSKDSAICETLGFSNTMPRDRFLAIWSTLHCVNEEDPQLDKTDKIYKARPVFNHLMKNFREYYVPHCHLSLDEGMIPTKNRLSFKQYIKDKPICWGIKTFLLCDSENGYVVNAEVYTGKKEHPNSVANLGVTGNLVVRMTDGYAGQYYSVFTDRFYTSVQLAEYLLTQKKTCLCGTAMTNRKEFPKQLVKKKNRMAKGESKLLFNGSVAALVCGWTSNLFILLHPYLFHRHQFMLCVMMHLSIGGLPFQPQSQYKPTIIIWVEQIGMTR